MSPIRRIIADLVADLLALRVMRAHVAAPDPTVPPSDRGPHSRKVRGPITKESRRRSAVALRAEARGDYLWYLTGKRGASLPNRPEWDGQAANLLIAGTSRTGVVRLAEGVDA